jgi:GrpB-like predicted nucleotidyltransferase (UPF0157 family)
MVLVSINYRPIRVEPPDDRWAEEFRRRADTVREALGEVARRIDHVGSTAVPGLDAKPTIDIQVSVADLEDLQSFRRPLERLGYTFHERSLEEVEHRFFSAPGRAAHIHICPSGSRWERTHLLFRDFLRTHPDVAGRYSWPPISARIMSRPETPITSLATLASLILASSRVFWSRLTSRVRSLMRAER